MTRQERLHRLRWMLTLLSMIMAIGILFIWVTSWKIETEVRWMHNGRHFHVELARGEVTVISTSGWASADYFTWDGSPDLSFGRDPDWYRQGTNGQPSRHLRIHWAVMPCIAAMMAFLSLRVVRKRSCLS